MAIDLDKARAARAEARGEGPTLIVDGVTYTLPPEMPFASLEAMRGLSDEATAPGALVDLARALLGEHYDAIAPGLTMPDLNELVGGVMQEYGVDRPLASSAS